MEHEFQPPMVGLLGCDREIFARVWGRVSPETGEGCPIQVLPPERVHTPSAEAPAPVAVPPRPPVDEPCPEEPNPGDVPCLGMAAADHNSLLQTCIRHELEDWRTYQTLARHSSGVAARTLAALAADEHRHAKRLSAAYFLISGVRFLPEVPMSRWGGSLLAALRRQFWAEQHGAAGYLSAAEESEDLCLAALYRDLAGEEAAHADLLRALVEQI